MFEQTDRHTIQSKQINTGPFTIEVTDKKTGRTYYFDHDPTEDTVEPLTIGAADEEGLVRACDVMRDKGFDVTLRGRQPAGFTYHNEKEKSKMALKNTATVVR